MQKGGDGGAQDPGSGDTTTKQSEDLVMTESVHPPTAPVTDLTVTAQQPVATTQTPPNTTQSGRPRKGDAKRVSAPKPPSASSTAAAQKPTKTKKKPPPRPKPVLFPPADCIPSRCGVKEIPMDSSTSVAIEAILKTVSELVEMLTDYNSKIPSRQSAQVESEQISNLQQCTSSSSSISTDRPDPIAVDSAGTLLSPALPIKPQIIKDTRIFMFGVNEVARALEKGTAAATAVCFNYRPSEETLENPMCAKKPKKASQPNKPPPNRQPRGKNQTNTQTNTQTTTQTNPPNITPPNIPQNSGKPESNTSSTTSTSTTAAAKATRQNRKGRNAANATQGGPCVAPPQTPRTDTQPQAKSKAIIPRPTDPNYSEYILTNHLYTLASMRSAVLCPLCGVQSELLGQVFRKSCVLAFSIRQSCLAEEGIPQTIKSLTRKLLQLLTENSCIVPQTTEFTYLPLNWQLVAPRRVKKDTP